MRTIFVLTFILFLFSCSEKEVATDTKPAADTTLTLQPSLVSEITCPKCKFQKQETMPDDYCILKYTCTNCKEVLYPDDKDCCIFCTYGTYKCPSKQ